MCFILSLPQSPSTPTCHPSFHPHPENPCGQWPPTPTGKGHPSLPTDGVVSPCSSLGSDRGRLVPVRPAGLCMGPPAKEERKMTSCIDGCIYISMQLVHNMPLNAEINGGGWGLVWWLNTIHIMMTSSNGSIFRVTGPLCGEFTGPGEFPTQRPVTRSFDDFFDERLIKRLNKHSRGWWIETLSHPLWRHRNVWFFSVQSKPAGWPTTFLFSWKQIFVFWGFSAGLVMAWC